MHGNADHIHVLEVHQVVHADHILWIFHSAEIQQRIIAAFIGKIHDRLHEIVAFHSERCDTRIFLLFKRRDHIHDLFF